MADKKKIVVICGPTASGKTGLSLLLAQKFNGEIISADSMQVYRKLDIGTAKATPREQSVAPHHLVDILEPDQPYNVQQFVVALNLGDKLSLEDIAALEEKLFGKNEYAEITAILLSYKREHYSAAEIAAFERRKLGF